MKRLCQETSKPELTLYQFLPLEEINYQKLKDSAIKRLKILRKIEKNIPDVANEIKSSEDDIIGHFSLKLLASQYKWSCVWFVNTETSLFKSRLTKNPETAKQFFLDSIWPYLNINGSIGPETRYDFSHSNRLRFDRNIKIHFTKCSELLVKHSYELKNGYFEMNDHAINAFIINEFREILESSINILHDRFLIESDPRIIKLSQELLFKTVQSTDTVSNKIIMENVKLFPLCIQGIIEQLYNEKHLKYNNRQTLCLFFKDIGMDINDCIAFFRSHYKCSSEEFNKEYLYSIRHNYGLEGKRANYGSFSCNKIMSFSNDQGSFGCPFIKNNDFVKIHTDIEDLSLDKGPFKCCKQVGSQLKKDIDDFNFTTPAEYFKILVKSPDNNLK